jgi:hypothetical protein
MDESDNVIVVVHPQESGNARANHVSVADASHDKRQCFPRYDIQVMRMSGQWAVHDEFAIEAPD